VGECVEDEADVDEHGSGDERDGRRDGGPSALPACLLRRARSRWRGFSIAKPRCSLAPPRSGARAAAGLGGGSRRGGEVLPMRACEGHQTHDGVQERTADAHGQQAPRHCAPRWRRVVRRGWRPRLHAAARGEGHLTIRLL
jgi:hypothetical protein